MSMRAFVAMLWLDLDSDLVQLYMDPTTVRCLDSVQRLHGNRAFGLVSLGRFLISIHKRDDLYMPKIVPAYRKVNGEWSVHSEVYTVLTGESPISGLYSKPYPALLDVRPLNRGPVYEQMCNQWRVPLSDERYAHLWSRLNILVK